ncbi:DUF3306 domain-containing protein [Stappia sp.]|uniref:DUF3306 domain-containing protein n=1 Tax=Stappia sp. TaxID=1870903 RepID=UPI003D0B8B9F
MTRETETGFLSRWSRRKQAVRDGDLSDDASGDALGVAGDGGDTEGEDAELRAEAARLEEENREAAEAVDLEALSFDSDYSVFLKKGVSTDLKNAALRKLWRSNPVLACVDGLNDYDEDFRTVQTLADGLKTSWQVGKGYSWMLEPKEGEASEPADAAAELAGRAEQDAAVDAETDLAGDGHVADAGETAGGEAAGDDGEPAVSLAPPDMTSAAGVPLDVEEAVVTTVAVRADHPMEVAPRGDPARPARRRMRFQ